MMDAVLATIVAGRQALIQLNIEVDEHILISTLIYWFKQYPLTVALDNICARVPTPQAAWIHQLHTAGEASGSNPMVVMFVVCFCCVFALPHKSDENDYRTRLLVLKVEMIESEN